MEHSESAAHRPRFYTSSRDRCLIKSSWDGLNVEVGKILHALGTALHFPESALTHFVDGDNPG